MNNTTKYFQVSWLKVLWPMFHILMLMLVYQLYILVFNASRTDPFFLKQWDAYWYGDIAEHGYQYNPEAQSNSGFFPFFPYLWKILWKATGAGVEGVCAMNAIIFMAALLLLKRAFNFSWLFLLLIMSLPGNIFMYVPYAESCYFFFCTMILVGIHRKSNWMIMTGLFFASLARPTALFLAPALIGMALLSEDASWRRVKQLLLYCLMPALAILLVLLLQYKATGVWMAYFKAQSEQWQRVFEWPQLPFTTWDGPRLLWLDAVALFFGLFSVSWILNVAFRRLMKRPAGTPDEVVLSYIYLLIALASVIFFNSTDTMGGTSLMSANRYVIASPFFVMALLHISRTAERKMYSIYLLCAALAISLLDFSAGAFRDYKAFEAVMYAMYTCIYILSFLLLSERWKDRFTPALYMVGCIMQVHLLHEFALTRWVG